MRFHTFYAFFPPPNDRENVGGNEGRLLKKIRKRERLVKIDVSFVNEMVWNLVAVLFGRF